MAGIGIALYFVLRPYLDSAMEVVGGVSNIYDILFVFFMCLSFVFVYQSVYYLDLGFYLSLGAAFTVLITRCAFQSSEALERRRKVNVLEGYALGAYVILSPYLLNFVPRWWDIYYAYSLFHNALASGGFNIVQTYHGFPLYYSFNGLLTLVGLGIPNELMYLPVNGIVAATAMIAVYMLARKLLNERAAQVALLAIVTTTLYADYILTALEFSLALVFFVLYLMLARGFETKSVIVGIGLIGLSLLLYHPSGAIVVDFSLLLLLGLELFVRKKALGIFILLIYSTISITYTLFVAASSFSFLVTGVTVASTSPYSNISNTITPFTYYWIIYYLPLSIPLIFGAFFLSYVLLHKRSKSLLFLALFPIAFALLSVAQIATGLGLAETSLDGFIPIAIVFGIGATFDRLSRRRVTAILSIALISLMFFTALIVPSDNLYFGKNSFSFQVPSFGTAQQLSATTVFYDLPAGSNVHVDAITEDWALGALSVIGIATTPLNLSSLAAPSYDPGLYLVYSTTAFPRYSVGGDPSLVYANVSQTSRLNDIVYSSGEVSAVFVI